MLARRGVITPTGTTARSGRSGGRPAALYRFTDDTYRVTDEFAALRPPTDASPALVFNGFLRDNGRMDLGSVAPAAGAEWIGHVPHEELGARHPSAAARR